MLMMRRFYLFFFCIFFISLRVFAEGFDHSALDQFLKQHIDSSSRINYALAKKNHEELDRYLDQLKSVDLLALRAAPKPERLAFWLNVYHAGLLSLVLENYPIKSTQDIPSFWERQFLRIGFKSVNNTGLYSLSKIRNDELVANFNDEKIHLALAFAAKDGPLFPNEVFTGPRVLGQLFKSARREVARREIVEVDFLKAPGRIRLSRIFEWYGPDFLNHYGRPARRAKLSRTNTAVVNFLIRYSKNLTLVRFLKSANYKIEYAPFDWTLNDTTSISG